MASFILEDKISKLRSDGGSTGVNDSLRKVLGGRRFDRIVEVGCNDCYLLNNLREYADELVGIDPVLAGREDEFSDTQLTVMGDFVENVELEKKPNTLYITSHVMEHLQNPRTMLESLVESAGEGSLFVFQFPGFDSLLQDMRFDQVYNHHLQYFSLHSIKYLIEMVGGRLLEYHVDPHYWGTLMVVFSLDGGSSVPCTRRQRTEYVVDQYRAFKSRMRLNNQYLKSFDERKFGYGAALQVPVLSYHMANNFSDFECILDDDERKDGKYFLNLPVLIRHPSNGFDLEGAVVLITAHNFSRKIIPRILPMNPKRIILPNGGI